jgi:hypothetical protein
MVHITVVLRSSDVHAPKGERQGVSPRMTKALVPQRSVNRRGTKKCVSKKGSVLTGKSLNVRKIVVHDEDEIAMRVARRGLSDAMVMETDVVSVPETLLRDYVCGTAFKHVGRVAARMRS